MARTTMTISTDTDFVEAIDQAVDRVRVASPHGYVSRSSFVKSAIRRAMDDLSAQPEPSIRTRHRASTPA